MLLAPPVSAARPNDFPTQERVLYVQECMQQHPGDGYEMISKCSCALDAVASEIGYDEYTTLHTATLAQRIAGERGAVLRDNTAVGKEVRRLREIQARANKHCFIDATAK
ncbi:hypothetical protein CCZ27_13305 [Thauera sinica]|nr:hypothetical protein CCZ27_13305 [Thauera sp. K11]